MKRISKRTTRKLLRSWHIPQPPEDLAVQLKRDIPEELHINADNATAAREGSPLYKERTIWSSWKVAACFVVFVAGTIIGIFISQRFFTDIAPHEEKELQAQKGVPVFVAEEIMNTGGFVHAAENPLSALDFEPQPASFDLPQQIKEGKLPSPENIRFNDFINHFELETLPPPKEDFAIQARGGASPFSSDPSFKLLKINIKAPDLEVEPGKSITIDAQHDAGDRVNKSIQSYLKTVAKDTKVEIEFNPNVVDVYRRIGSEIEKRIKKDMGSICIVKGKNVRACEAATALYEVRLKQQVKPDDSVATLKLQYILAGEDLSGLIKLHTISVPLFVTSLERESPDIEFAAILAQYTQVLKDLKKAETKDLKYLADRAKLLVEEIPEKEDLEEFIQLVEATEKIKKEIQAKKAKLESIKDNK